MGYDYINLLDSIKSNELAKFMPDGMYLYLVQRKHIQSEVGSGKTDESKQNC